MKKYLVILMAIVLVFTLCSPICLADPVAEAPAPMFTVNVTQLIIAVMAVIFNALLAWIIKALIPPVRRWLDEHTTSQQQYRVWTIIKWVVEAAEQTIVGYAKGPERMEWVISELRARGIEVDRPLIEAAVNEMKNSAAAQLKEAINTNKESIEVLEHLKSK